MEAAKQRFEALVAFRQRIRGHSGQQLQVLGLYKRFLRVARAKDQKTDGDMAQAIRNTFRERLSIPKCAKFQAELTKPEPTLKQ